jgi:peptidoglycan/xylan/chitin deacetylase (PgdA/CDA1 family)
MSSGRLLSRFLQSFLARGGEGIQILAYHLIGAGTSSPVDVPDRLFRSQMSELDTLARPVSLERAVGYLTNGEAFERPRVVVSFDDAYENFYSSAWPVLWELRTPTILFVPVCFVEGRGCAPILGTDHLPPLSWSQLNEMVSTGLLSIGSHSCSHVDLRSLSRKNALDELTRSRRILEDRLGQKVNSFCYPRGLWSRQVEEWVSSVYDFVLVGGGWKLTPSNFNPTRMWRVSIRRDMPISLRPVIDSRVCIEEWLADGVRRFFSPSRRGEAKKAGPSLNS